MLTISCSSCHKKLSVPEDVAGKKVKCAACGQVMTVPAPAAAGVSVKVGNANPWTTMPPALNPDPPTIPPQQADASDAPTNPSLSRPDATHGAKPNAGHDASLTDFLAKSQADDELGRLGKYRILKILGHGGMGVVFLGEDPKLGRKVAIKAMLPHLAESKSSQQRFLREARSAATLEHDHIVPIFQVDEDRGAPYIVMPFLKGEPLDERLNRPEPMPLAEILRIGREIAEGLNAAHATGLVHRDIKPANIWLEQQTSRSRQEAEPLSALPDGRGSCGRVKILDFGLARAVTEDSGLTQQGAIIGTPAYMAPEQGRGDPIDARCDLFSLGVILYRLCTGQQPFQGKDTVSTLMAVAMNAPVAPITLNSELPLELSDLVMKLLEKDPAQRLASAAAAVETLRAMEKKMARQQMAEEKTESLNVADVKHAISTQPRSPGRSGAPSRTGPARRGGPTQSRPRRKWVALIAVAAIGVFGMLLLGAGAIVLYWQTNNGTVRIEINDPKIKVAFDTNGPVITGVDKQDIKLTAGAHGLSVERGDMKLDTDKFILKKGETITLKIEWLEDGKLQVMQGGKVIGAKGQPKGDVANGPKFKNSLGMEFALVPKGKAWLGGGGGKPGDREVYIHRDFFLGVYEVTQGEWQKVMDNNPSRFSRDGESKDAVKDVSDADLKRFPVENVSWRDCQEFLKKLNEKTKEAGWVYRLPTEVEWEYACRGGPMADKAESAFDFYFDKPFNGNAAGQANFAGTGPVKVGTYRPNRLGLYDMHGNVWESCHGGQFQNPIRGGGWALNWGHNANGRRGMAPDHQSGDQGLRVARLSLVSLPLTPAWFKQAAALPVAERVNAVADKLKERNPGFDGTVIPTIDYKAGVVTGLQIRSDKVTDISPVRALSGLQTFKWAGAGVADLSPLKGMQLTSLSCGNSNVSDLSPLKDMPLTHLDVGATKVSDLKPLDGMKLTTLHVNNTLVADLSPLSDMKLTNLVMHGAKVNDLSPLKGMPLEQISCDFRAERDAPILRAIPTLKTINGTAAAAFWKDVEQKKP